MSPHQITRSGLRYCIPAIREYFGGHVDFATREAVWTKGDPDCALSVPAGKVTTVSLGTNTAAFTP